MRGDFFVDLAFQEKQVWNQRLKIMNLYERMIKQQDSSDAIHRFFIFHRTSEINYMFCYC